jgi:hypothetical protein
LNRDVNKPPESRDSERILRVFGYFLDELKGGSTLAMTWIYAGVDRRHGDRSHQGPRETRASRGKPAPLDFPPGQKAAFYAGIGVLWPVRGYSR